MARKTPAKASKRNSKNKTRTSPANKRAVWTGNMRLALVSVPIEIYPATSSGARISFHQVHEPSGQRVRYQKVVPGIGPVDTDEIVKGFEVKKGSYLLIEPEEIDALKLEAKETLDLVQFVPQGEIDPIWFDRPYYVVPDGESAEEAFGVLRDAMRATRKLGLGQFVMRGREYIAAMKPCGNGLMLETLHFADEVRDAAPYFTGIDKSDADDELRDMATDLIERKTAAFDPDRFEDQYTKALRELIDTKAKRKKPIDIEEDDGESRGAEVIDLVEALKKSVKASGGKGATGGRKKKRA